MQYLDRLLNSLDVHENYSSEGHVLNARNLHTYLSKVMYKRRSDINPLWNQMLVAGLDGEDKPFLSSVDLLGTTFSSPTLATGFGAHLAQPLLRKLADDESQVMELRHHGRRPRLHPRVDRLLSRLVLLLPLLRPA